MHVESGTTIHEIFQQWIFLASPVILLNQVDVLSSPLPQFVFYSFTWHALFLPVFVFQTLALSVKVCIHLRSSQCITDYTMWQHTSDPLPTLYKQSHCSSLGMPRVCFSLQGCVKHCTFESEFVMINVQSVLVANQIYLLNSLHSLIFIKPDYTSVS